MTNNREIKFLESYTASTSVVPEVISRLIDDLEQLNVHPEEKNEITISMDEAITNAIQETIRKKGSSGYPPPEAELRDITIRYIINDEEFDATIIDHGKGLDIFNIIKDLPDRESSSYENQILTYAMKSEKDRIKVTLNGKEISLKGIGAGLKIILNFMDHVKIDLIDKQKVISDLISSHTDGTIFNMRRKRRYK